MEGGEDVPGRGGPTGLAAALQETPGGICVVWWSGMGICGCDIRRERQTGDGEDDEFVWLEGGGDEGV